MMAVVPVLDTMTDLVARVQVAVAHRRTRGRDLVVLDVDNTLADTWPSLVGDPEPHHRRLARLAPLPAIKAVAHDEPLAAGAAVVFLTHRPLWCRGVTRRWLRRHGYDARRRNVVLVARPASKVPLIAQLARDRRRTVVWDDLTWNHEHGEVRRYDDVADAFARLGVVHHGAGDIVRITGQTYPAARASPESRRTVGAVIAPTYARVSRRLALLAQVARRFPFRGLLRHLRRNATVVVWIHHRLPGGWCRYLANGDLVVNDLALLRAFLEAGIDVRVVFGPRIGEVANRTIAYSIESVNPLRLADHSAGLRATLRELEAQGNRLLPSADEAELWENKVAMHEALDRAGIATPTTVVLRRHDDAAVVLAAADLRFPLLAKEPHSCNGRGVHLVASPDELAVLRAGLARRGDHDLLVQRLVDMRRDLRVTVIGDEVVHHYWRVNPSATWRPTTTRHGSIAEFDGFPERWRAAFVDAAARLGLVQAAFDVCWEGDDVSTEPLVLEVSPAFSPNPPPSDAFVGRPYAAFRARRWGRGAQPAAFVELVCRQHGLRVRAWDPAGVRAAHSS